MPGITGIISKTPKEKNEKDLQIMVGSMLHESFYNSGTYTNDKIRHLCRLGMSRRFIFRLYACLE